MTVEQTERGFEIVRFKDLSDAVCSLQQSSAVLTYPDALQRPGSSAVWLGRAADRMHISREQARLIVQHLQSWLETGSFELPDTVDGQPAEKSSN